MLGGGRWNTKSRLRGKRNEPAFVAHIAAFLGALRGETLEDIAAQTTANFHALFKHAVAA